MGSAEHSALALANKLMKDFGGLDGLERAGFGELCKVNGIGEAKVAQIKAALALGRRAMAVSTEVRQTVKCPQDVYNLLGEMSFLDQEELRVILLNTKNQVVAIKQVYRGNVNSSQVRPAEVLQPAVRENCLNIIVVHNHPSGDPGPSPEDVVVTKSFVEAGKVLGIDVLDHIIIGRQGCVSLKELRQGFS